MSELERLLAQYYGQGYQPDLGGDDFVTDTRNVLSTMGAQKTARDHQGYEALARLFTTVLAPWAAAPTGALAANAVRRPTAGATAQTPRQAALET